MAPAAEELVAANQRVTTITWRVVQLSLLVVGLSSLSLVIGMYHHPFPWTGAFTGIILLVSGYQLRLAQGQFDRLAPTRPRVWLQPMAYALYLLGALLLALGLVAAGHR